MVPHWVRGAKEEGKILLSSKTQQAPICALGGSIRTNEKGITAQVIEVKNFDELTSLGTEKIKGKIVFFNHPMDATKFSTMEAYGEAVPYRSRGAVKAASFGAIGVIVRSMSLIKEDFPHTGGMWYNDSIAKIPACAISTNGADFLSRSLKTEPALQFYLKMNCEQLEDAPSFNVVGEIKGSEKPEKIILVGGHLDSWDTGKGAHDDGTGVVGSIEVLRILQSIHYKPKCTIRVVAFMNEENGTRGAKKYAELAKANKETHVAVIESDKGGFSPRGFNIDATKEVRQIVKSWRLLLEPYGVYNFEGTEIGSDIEPIVKTGVTGFELLPDLQRYFDVNNSPQDTFDKVNKRELEMGGAAMAALIYLIDVHGLSALVQSR